MIQHISYEIPNWISFNKYTKILVIDPPAVNQKSSYAFAIISKNDEFDNPAYKAVYLIVEPVIKEPSEACSVDNCLICSETSTTI